MHSTNGALIVQGDRTIYLEVGHPDFERVRERLATFAELEKSPENVHVYRITPISLWNAAANGASADDIVGFLKKESQFPVPGSLRQEIESAIARHGRVRLVRDVSGELCLASDDRDLLAELVSKRRLSEHLADPERAAEDAASGALRVRPECRGAIKLALAKVGYPVDDLAGYRDGRHLSIELREALGDGSAFTLRPYQHAAVEAFHAGGTDRGGSGVVVLPCGAGKTVVGIGVLQQVQRETLILTTNISALRQWKRELLEKTTLTEDLIGEYSGEVKEVRPVTISTYQILTHRRSKVDEFTHFRIFSENQWGLIIYDEVHLLPAPVFRFTAEIQATRRLGLTATLVREDGREPEVFSLIGPRKYDLPWRSLESGGWIATAECQEIRVDLDHCVQESYLGANGRGKFRLSSENPAKTDVVRTLVSRHRDDRILVLGQYVDQLESLGESLGAPVITGKTATPVREDLYERFRDGRTPVLIVSKVGNFAIDLPEANVAIQISGTFGSRQEEAQRLGRILRPKKNGSAATFYSIVTRGSREQEFAEKRQLFLTEQGYRYVIRDAADLSADDDEGYRRVQCS